MRITGIAIALLMVGLALALGLPSWANGRQDVAIGIGVLGLLGLAVTVAAYGPWAARFDARWSPLKRAAKPYLFVGFCLIASVSAIQEAWWAVSVRNCTVPEGARSALARSLLRGVCEHFGYPVFAAVNLLFVAFFAWLGLFLWRTARAERRD